MDTEKENAQDGDSGPLFQQNPKTVRDSPSKPSILEEKAAYFEMLRLWVVQAKLYQSTAQCYPYLLPHAAGNATQTNLIANNAIPDRNQRDDG